MKTIFAVFLLLAATASFGQGSPTTGILPDSGITIPASCSAPQLFFQTRSGGSGDGLYQCHAGTFQKLGTGSGSGTVTSVLGTANQIISDGSTTTPTLSVATTFTFPGTVTNNLGIFGATTSAQLAGIISNETGTGLLVFATNPALTTPDLGTPSAATLTNATGLPISSGVSGLGTGVATFLATPSSANLIAALTDETGTGSAVFSISPIFTGTITGAAETLTGVFTNSANGALSAAAISITGAPIQTGGTATTTFPLVYLNSGAAVTSFSTVGTEFGINAPSGFAGNFEDYHLNGGASVFKIDAGGGITSTNYSMSSAGSITGASLVSTGIVRAAAASSFQFLSSTLLKAPSDGVLQISNSGSTGLTRLDLGLTTSSGPAFCISGTTITGCLGDGTAGSTWAVPTLQATTSATIGGGTPILKVLSATATLDFGSLVSIGCEDLTVTVTGAALGDTVAIGVPNGSVPSATFTFTGWVSATNTVTIRGCALVSGDPASGTFRATVTQF